MFSDVYEEFLFIEEYEFIEDYDKLEKERDSLKVITNKLCNYTHPNNVKFQRLNISNISTDSIQDESILGMKIITETKNKSGK